jgi:farnesyl-diphosphate farnesyltransferase
MVKKENRHFVNEFIPKVSRTFALAIKFLPVELRHTVFTAYLLCRVADTIEDSPFIAPDEKQARLLHLKNLLMAGVEGGSVSQDEIAPLYLAVDSQQGDDHRLLSKSRELFEVLSELPSDKRRIIYRWAGEMAGGMAEFSKFTAPQEDQVIALESVAQWDRYCYYVAGTVGWMLTELFIAQFRIEKNVADEMKRLCNSFGLGLQKVNTIKDVPGDMARGVVFLPQDLMAKHGLSASLLKDAKRAKALNGFVQDLVEITGQHLDDAISYTILLPERLKGVRIFLSVPVFLARETLTLIAANPVQTMVGPPVKLTRRDVVRLTAMARLHSSSNETLKSYYLKLKRKK